MADFSAKMKSKRKAQKQIRWLLYCQWARKLKARASNKFKGLICFSIKSDQFLFTCGRSNLAACYWTSNDEFNVFFNMNTILNITQSIFLIHHLFQQKKVGPARCTYSYPAAVLEWLSALLPRQITGEFRSPAHLVPLPEFCAVVL